MPGVKKSPLVALFALLFVSLFSTSCESTLDYGYYVGELNDQTILQLFALSDEAATNLDFSTYESFFAPNYVAVDAYDSNRTRIYRQDYLGMVKDIFDTAKEMMVQSMVMDIEYSATGQEALVKIQEEEKVVQFGNTRHYTSLIDVDVAIEDGWIFINKTTRTSMQVIEE